MRTAAEGCIIGIDPGERWIGVARAAPDTSLALPVGTLDRRQGDDLLVQMLHRLLGGEAVATLVVGVPLRPDGREDAQASAFRQFGESLATSIGAVCVPQDERFSSEPAVAPQSAPHGRKARASGRKSVQRQRRERERSHAAAAARILQRWIDIRDGAQARAAAVASGDQCC